MATTTLTCLVLLLSCLCYAYADEVIEKCPEMYTFSAGDNTCLRVYNSRMPMAQAKAKCAADNNGRLVEIKDQETHDLVVAMASRYRRYWVGIEMVEDNTFQYISGGQLSDVLVWAKHQPSLRRPEQHCVEMITRSGGLLNDKRCRRNRAFICQVDAKKEEKPFTPVESPHHMILSEPPATGNWITVRGIPHSNSPRCAMDLFDARTGNLALHLNPRFYGDGGVTVRNSMISGRWGPEERDEAYFPFARETLFVVDIVFRDDGFEVYNNGNFHFKYNYRMPFADVNMIQTAGSCDYEASEFHTDPYTGRNST